MTASGALRTRGLLAKLQSAGDAGQFEDDVLRPDCIELGPRPGVQPSTKPAVRIFLGTEPAQYRAERIFVWSIEGVRDPSRTYQVYLMRDLRGFDRRRWLTGFTGYRFAIPEFAGAAGRAIYNDVDQIYLADPAELFDADLGDHGFLAIPAQGAKGVDTSVMLIDCERMSAVWTPEATRHERKKTLLANALADPGLMGALDPRWNARDDEYREGHSCLLHYTALHTQPWRPFPHAFVYQHNPVGQVWADLERAADEEGFQVHGPQRPSARFRQRREQLLSQNADVDAGQESSANALPTRAQERLEAVLTELQAESLLLVGPGAADGVQSSLAEAQGSLAGDPGLSIDGLDPLRDEITQPTSKHDLVLAAGGLAQVPDEDIPWVLDELFARTGRCCAVLTDEGAPGDRARDAEWWTDRMRSAGARHPGLHWEVWLSTRARAPHRRLQLLQGGHPLQADAPEVWVLCDGRPGHADQSLALAEVLGWPCTKKELRFRPLAALHRVHDRIFGATRVTVDRRRSSDLQPPWPDLVIAAGRRTAPVARWIAAQSAGRTRLVQLGRKGGHVADQFDLVVTPTHCRYPPHPHRFETRLPLNPVTTERLQGARERFGDLFDGGPRPHVVLLVGGSTGLHRLEPDTVRRMAEEALSLARQAGGSVFAITSRRTGAATAAALEQALQQAPPQAPGDPGRVHRWRPDETDNPYPAYLALADAIIVSGESESMLADSLATGKPVYLFPVPQRRPGLKTRLRDWVYSRSQDRPLNKRGTVRPQQGLEHLCSLLVARGFIEPPRNLELLHEKLLQDGVVRRLGEPLELEPTEPPPREVDRVAQRVRALLSMTGTDARSTRRSETEHA